MKRGVIAAALVGALALLAGVALVGYRVFKPQETLTRPDVAYPSVMMITDERPFSELRAAPLVVENRLRVYAEKRRVWSDAPVGGRYEATPYWSYRRWPAQVVGVASVSIAKDPFVITQWSDGEVITLNARLGEIVWRTKAQGGASSYDGRRTGASVVYEPQSLLTVKTRDSAVIVVTAPGLVTALAADTGTVLWQREVEGGCEPAAWTAPALLVLPACSGATLEFVEPTSGRTRERWTPERGVAQRDLCALGRTECRLVRADGKAWLLGSNGTLTAVPPIEDGAVLAGERVILQTPEGVVARRLRDGSPLWTYKGTGTLIAADTVGVYLLLKDRTLIALSPVTGHLSVLGCAAAAATEDWQIGHIYTTDGSYVALERITREPASSKDQLYYYGPRPVALVELYPPNKLPVWPGKFAACGRLPE